MRKSTLDWKSLSNGINIKQCACILQGSVSQAHSFRPHFAIIQLTSRHRWCLRSVDTDFHIHSKSLGGERAGQTVDYKCQLTLLLPMQEKNTYQWAMMILGAVVLSSLLATFAFPARVAKRKAMVSRRRKLPSKKKLQQCMGRATSRQCIPTVPAQPEPKSCTMHYFIHSELHK